MDSILASVDVIQYIDIKLVLLLLAIGFLVKHFIPKISNKLIPYILFGFSIIDKIIGYGDFSFKGICGAIVDAIICAAIAIGLHSSGKGIIYLVNSTPTITSDSASDDESESTATDTDETVDEDEEVEEDYEVEDDV